MFEVIIDGVSSKNFGIVIEHRPAIPTAKKKYKTYQIEGRDGTLTEFLGYEDKKIEIDFGLINRENLSKKIREISGWLLNGKELKFSDDLDIFYKIKSISMEDVIRSLRVIGRFKVTFILDPFSYANEEEITLTNATIIHNQGTILSKPYFKIYGNGTITLNVNSENITLNTVESYIEIDCELMQCKKGSTNTNNKMVGSFPSLQLGANSISWTGTVTEIELIPRWRFL